MAPDLGLLGLGLSLIGILASYFGGNLFRDLDPKEFVAVLDLQVDRARSRLVNALLRRMENERERYQSQQAVDPGFASALLEARKFATAELIDDALRSTSDLVRILYCARTWRRWVDHGRTAATVTLFMYLAAFVALVFAVWAIGISVPRTPTVYWLALSAFLLPLPYIFLCWIQSSRGKRECQRLMDELSLLH
jgi:hypothetical protein